MGVERIASNKMRRLLFLDRIFEKNKSFGGERNKKSEAGKVDNRKLVQNKLPRRAPAKTSCQ